MKLVVKDITVEEFNTDFVPRLREEDAAEWKAYTGMTPAQLVEWGWRVGTTYKPARMITRGAYTDDGIPLCVWGCSPMIMNHHQGWVWLVATPECVPKARFMHRELYRQLDEIMEMYPLGVLTESWINNPIHQSWLNWLGFKQADKFTVNGHIFVQHKLEHKPCA